MIYNLGTISLTIDYHALPFLRNMSLANFPQKTIFKAQREEKYDKHIHVIYVHKLTLKGD